YSSSRLFFQAQRLFSFRSGIHYSSSPVFPSGAFWGILGRHSRFDPEFIIPAAGYSLQAYSGAF
ncbi:hypothetical protein, partial [Paenibacillus elgii]|uniref:hypothetical protein n=1 Tax=Paenibacillus elgii TaxID=189691 RepID=UPI00203C9BCF